MAPSGSNAPARAAADVAAVRLSKVHLALGHGAAAVNVLNGVDLAIATGESVGITGPSGSGKSTLLMVMGGLERIDSGEVAIAGVSLAGLDEDALARFRRRRVGIVFQSFHLIPTMTALENVAVPLELAGMSDAFERARAELSAVGLGHRLQHRPQELSGGEQQRVAIARALAPEPTLLIADEPTGNLDEASGAAIVDLMFRAHADRRTTLVIVTHDAGLARACGRTVRMRAGLIETDEADAAA